MLLLAAALAICATGPRDHCVHDGDTFWHHGEKIRIADIDTPEINGKCEAERKLAIRARDRLLTILSRGYEVKRTGTDRYGRTLAIIMVEGRSAGTMLVEEGLARAWTGRREPWCPIP